MTINVLAIGGNRLPYHPFDVHGPALERALQTDAIDVTLTTARDELESISDFDVLVDYLTDSTLEDRQLAGVLDFVEDGGGYVGLHCAADLTSRRGDNREQPISVLRELIGGHFLEHPQPSTFTVNVVDSHHPITADLDHFEVWDEPYVLDVDPAVRVLLRMDHPENGDMAVAWVKEYGDGRVLYCSLGHDWPALEHDTVRQLLRRGVRWTA